MLRVARFTAAQSRGSLSNVPVVPVTSTAWALFASAFTRIQIHSARPFLPGTHTFGASAISRHAAEIKQRIFPLLSPLMQMQTTEEG